LLLAQQRGLGALFVSAGCLLALLPCHQPPSLAIERTLFHSPAGRRLWKTL